MKPSLERTAILSKDVTEQAINCDYVVMLPDANMIFAADTVNHEEGEIQVYANGQMIAAFAPGTKWYMVRKDCIDIVPRELQIRRMAENMKAEKDLWNNIMPEFKVSFDDMNDKKDDDDKGTHRGGNGYGLYL